MSFDPKGKMSKLRAAKELAKTLARKPYKPGRLTTVEKAIVGEIVKTGDLTPAQTVALAVTLDRKPDTIATVIKEARTRLQENATKYVNLHIDAGEQALADRDYDVARKAAEWAIEKISTRSDDGKVERIVEIAQQNDQSPKIMIGIALGGMKASENT